MMVVDLNLLRYAVNRDSAQHAAAKVWVERTVAGSEPAAPAVVVLSPGDEHWRVLRALLAEPGTAGNLTTDAHLPALAIEHGAELCSSDADFGRFASLRWVNPLVA